MNKKSVLQQQSICIVGLALVVMILYYNNYKIHLIILSTILLALWGIEGKYFNGKKYVYGLWVLQYGFILAICSQEVTGMAILLLLVMVSGIVIYYPFKIGIVSTVMEWTGYISMMRLIHGDEYGTYPFFMTTMNFIIIYLFAAAIRYQVIQRRKAQQMAAELAQKTEVLNKAYEKLQEYYEEQKEVALLKERNRIAGEIHDTVGHRLTNAIVQLEATKRLMAIDKDRAAEKLIVIQNEVKGGLQDIRQAVRAMKEEPTDLTLQQSLTSFLNEVAVHNELTIEKQIASFPIGMRETEIVLFRCVQEGITNGIRHGKSKWFKIVLECQANKIQLSIEDRGEGTDHVVFGFGLYNMERKIKELNGQLEIISKKGEGTKLLIQLPFIKE